MGLPGGPRLRRWVPHVRRGPEATFPGRPPPRHRTRPTSVPSPNTTPSLVCRFSAGRRSLAGSTGWPTSARVYPSCRAASRRSGSRPPRCSPASARSCGTSWRRPRTPLPPPWPPPWPAPLPAPGPGATQNCKRGQSHTLRAVPDRGLSAREK